MNLVIKKIVDMICHIGFYFTIEELGELAECFTKGKPNEEKAEELADILILILGHAIAMNVDLEYAFNKKMKEIMKRPAIMGDLGIRVTNYKQ